MKPPFKTLSTEDIQYFIFNIKEKFSLELSEKLNPIQIENKTFELEPYYSKDLQTRILRIGPLIFIEVAGNIFNEDYITPETLKNRILELKEHLGLLYIDNMRSILFVRPTVYVENPLPRTRFLLNPHTILPIAEMLAYCEEFMGKSGLDLGAGDGLLARVALRLGAFNMTLIDWNDLQLEKAKVFLDEDGYSKTKIIQENLLDHPLPILLKNDPSIQNTHFIVSNIGTHDRIEDGNRASLNIIRELSGINLFIHAGYTDHDLQDRTSFLEIQKNLMKIDFNITSYRYFWNPVHSIKRVGVTALIARKRIPES